MRINASLKTEVVNGEVLVLDSQSSVVHRLTGDAATYVTRLINEPGTELPDNEITAGLITSGIVEETSMSRRRLVATAASLAAMGIVTLALPSAAAAASGPVSGPGGSNPGEEYQTPSITAKKTVVGGLANQRIVEVSWFRDETGGSGAVIFDVVVSGAGVNNVPVTASGQIGLWSSASLNSTWSTGETVTVTVTGTSANIVFYQSVEVLTLARPA